MASKAKNSVVTREPICGSLETREDGSQLLMIWDPKELDSMADRVVYVDMPEVLVSRWTVKRYNKGT